MMERLQEDYNHIALTLFIQQIKEQDANGKMPKEVSEAVATDMDAETILAGLKEKDRKLYSKLDKLVRENARYVLPNACEAKIQVTMNVRALFNFFKERLCDRAQEEIRDMAYEMWLACMEIAPTIFKYAVPTCVHGKCKEGEIGRAHV